MFNFNNSITHTPIPRFGDIARSFFSLNNKNVSEHWCDPENLCLSFSRSALSIKLIASWRQKVNNHKKIVIWLPDFFCDESLVFLRELKVKIVFYPVDAECSPNWSHFPDSKSDSPDIFFIVHYFGKPSPAIKAIEFCKAQNAWLIEDAAHVIEPDEGIGDFGDIVLYSPHKHFAIPDGAFLVVRDKGPSDLLNAKNSINIVFLHDLYSQMINSKRSGNSNLLWFSKRLIQLLGFRAKKNIVSYNLSALQTSLTAKKMSGMSKISNKLLKIQLFRINHIKAHRKKCAQKWESSLGEVFRDYDVKFQSSLNSPYLTYLTFKEQSMANFYFYLMQDVNLPVTSWPDLSQEVINLKANHEIAFTLRKTRIYLPVHQSVEINKIDYFVKKLKIAMIEKSYE